MCLFVVDEDQVEWRRSRRGNDHGGRRLLVLVGSSELEFYQFLVICLMMNPTSLCFVCCI